MDKQCVDENRIACQLAEVGAILDSVKFANVKVVCTADTLCALPEIKTSKCIY
jgi:hypothetical protein